MPTPHRSGSALRTSLDFLCFERLNSLGWNMPLPLFKILCGTGVAVLLPVLFAVTLLASRVLRSMSLLPAPALVGGFLLTNLYVGGAYLLREMYSRRRHSVSGSPNEGFFRALDVRARDIFLAYCASRILLHHTALLTVDAAFLIVFRATLSSSLAVVLACVPLALCALSLAVSAQLAAGAGTGAAARTGGPAVLVGLGALLFLTGLATGMLLDLLGSRTAGAFQGWATEEGGDTAPVVGRTYVILLLTTALACGVRLSGGQLLPLPPDMRGLVTRTAVAVTFVLLLGCVELVLARRTWRCCCPSPRRVP
ncbi:hypothetical protein [Streptomyces sp. WAC06614]|uniref:hypothetical protein n=1 Tax=Streptomyces sp. WAC06614 TaxID=2487416 RepID=UPI000F7A8E63|nr:hypothetical protein [Streptomyces sp. WAC06614]RSS79568.1 hypothetical protein EF918_16785 [Streptomyces sp. WAC06614]